MILKKDSTKSNKRFEQFLDLHLPQLESSDVPEHFWETLSNKLQSEIFDAGNYFQMCQCVDEEDCQDCNWEVIVINPDGIKTSDPNSIFLIDHAWTYEASEAITSLLESEGLVDRMCALMDVSLDGLSETEKVNRVLKEMWKFNGTYKMVNAASSQSSEAISLWYVMDEFGSRMQHDGEPNFRTVPFFYHFNKCCYSLLFPVKDVECGAEVTRNYVETPPVDELTRDAQMLPWFPMDLSHAEPLVQPEPSNEFFENERKQENFNQDVASALPLPSSGPLKVFTDYEFIRSYLTDGRYEIVEGQDEADIIWLSTHFKDYDRLGQCPHKRVNQFPCEGLLTVKDLLAIVSRRCEGGSGSGSPGRPPWFIPTYCLKRELAKFAANFQLREKSGLDNTWIVKPWNLARGIDHTVTDDLNHILRLSSTGPKIAQKYLHRPVLFYREDLNVKVKFDLRFIVLLLNVKPLKAAVYKNFWIRFANEEFSLDRFYDYKKHFTVNNYNDSGLLQMFCDDFIRRFESQHPGHSWSEVTRKVLAMVQELFLSATSFNVPKAIPSSPQSRSSYGFDVMLDWEEDQSGSMVMQPKLLEVNFNADCQRACEYYPDFFNSLFNVMFLDEKDDENFHFLSKGK